MSSRTYDFTLGAAVGAAQRFDVMGSRFRIMDADYPLSVKTDAGDQYVIQAGQGFTMPEGKRFREIYIANTVALANGGTLLIGDSQLDDARITGEVYVIDQSYAKTMAGLQYFQGVQQAAVVGQGSLVHMRLGGARKAAVRLITIMSTVAGPIQLGTGVGGGTLVAGGGPANSKLLVGMQSSALVTATPMAGTAPTVGEVAGAAAIAQWAVSANVPVPIEFATPLVLTGSVVLWVGSMAMNRDLQVVFDFEEFA